jgi:GT2 family glycosyltransferase
MKAIKNIILDIIIVTYNSKKWINSCLTAISNSDFPSDKISIIVVDNCSSESIQEDIELFKTSFGSIKFIENKSNYGFGKANDIGSRHAVSDLFLFLNPDTEIHKMALKELFRSSEADEKDVALWELRQFPYEHPKYYNPINLEVSWSSAAACMVRKSAFESVGGFDENIYLYCEDVDLSWRLKSSGYKLKYVPKAIVYHYSYSMPNEIKPTQFYESIKNNLLLRYKFGSLKDIISGYGLYISALAAKEAFPGSRRLLVDIFIRHFMQVPRFFSWRFTHRGSKIYKNFVGWNYEIHRCGAFYRNELPNSRPLVSIITRTIGRTELLKGALASLRNQTYDNIEIIVVEDGEPISQRLISTEFKDLNIKYICMGVRTGRCKAGNAGLRAASGEYIGFLDDDDVLYPEHIEVLVSNLEKNKKFNLAYAMAFETPIKKLSDSPYVYEELEKRVVYKQPFNRIYLFYSNYITIQNVLFNKKLYEELNGFDEKLDFFEDWDLWIRYSLSTDFLFVPKLTSIYRVPGEKEEKTARDQAFAKALPQIREKEKDLFYSSDIYSIICDFECIEASNRRRIYERVVKNNPLFKLLVKGMIRLYKLIYKN